MSTSRALHARWRVQGGTGQAEIRTMSDVDQFIGSLGGTDIDDASLTHTGRPLVTVPMMGDDPVPDHVVHVAVRDGWGYLIYAGASAQHVDGFTGHPEGDPRSPGTFGSYDEYPSGSGLPLSRLAEVLIGFLEAGELPTGVAWVSQDDQV